MSSAPPTLVAIPSELPDPPYPADTAALTWRIPCDWPRILASDTWQQCEPELRPWLLMLWFASINNMPCGSWPHDTERVAKAIGCQPEFLRRNRAMLLRGWMPCNDGRLYHGFITRQVLKLLDERARVRAAMARGREKKRDAMRGSLGAEPQASPEKPVTRNTSDPVTRNNQAPDPVTRNTSDPVTRNTSPNEESMGCDAEPQASPEKPVTRNTPDDVTRNSPSAGESCGESVGYQGELDVWAGNPVTRNNQAPHSVTRNTRRSKVARARAHAPTPAELVITIPGRDPRAHPCALIATSCRNSPSATENEPQDALADANPPADPADPAEPEKVVVPHKDILAAYHEILPTWQKVKTYDVARRRAVVARWKSDLPSLEHWRRYFARVARSPFLNNRTEAVFRNDNFDFLLRPCNLRKVIEGHFDERGKTNGTRS